MTDEAVDPSALAARLDALTARVQQLDDVLAVQKVITSYGLGCDAGDADAVSWLYAEDTEIDIDRVVHFHGREQARLTVESDAHQTILGECAHVMGPYAIEVDGDRAVATGYATVFVREDGVVKPWRQAYGRFELERRDGRWQITKRVSRAVGSPDRADVLGPPSSPVSPR